nr:uncharacterized protein LOC113826473 [Penaeus vannamei]
MTSGRVCSAILSIPQEDVVVPNIAETSLKSSGPKKVLVTWQKPQEDADVSSYVITWSSSSPVSSSPSSPSSSTTPGLANLPVLHPLGLIQRARPLGDDVQDLSFVVLPAATTSVEVEDLEASQNYEMCVSSVKSDVMGTPTCSEVNQGDYQPLDSPKNLTHEDEVLRWADVPGAASYLVEWQADYEGELSEGGLEEVNGTSWPTQDLPPGAWVVEVRAVSDTSASETASITIRKAGIVVGQPTQTNNSHLEISWWEEPVPSCHQPPYEYSITLLIDGREEKYNHSCSGCRGDCTKLLDVEGAKESVVVKVERDTKSIQVELRVYVFKAVPSCASASRRAARRWRCRGRRRRTPGSTT